MKKIKESNNNWGIVYSDIKEFLKGSGNQVSYPMIKPVSVPMIASASGSGDGVTNFRWDTVNIGTGIEISNDKKTAFLREGPYMFRTVIGDTVISLLSNNI